MKMLFIEPVVPHYRIPFFDSINAKHSIRVVFGRNDKSFLCPHRNYISKIRSLSFSYFEYYFVISEIIKFKPEVIISVAELKQFHNITLLFLKLILRYKLVFWTHGLSKKRTIKDKLKLAEFSFSNGVIFYTENCMRDAKDDLPKKHICFLNNTLDTAKIIDQKNTILESKEELKAKYKIKTAINGIFISRFTKIKNPDLLLEIMIKSHAKNKEIGFLIIGNGKNKPDFTNYEYIYDFNEVYDELEKAKILKTADFSIMPNGIGLSIIECFCFGIPMFTISTTTNGTKHGVEYNYLNHFENGFIAGSTSELISAIANISIDSMEFMSKNAYKQAKDSLTMENMVNNFEIFIKSL